MESFLEVLFWNSDIPPKILPGKWGYWRNFQSWYFPISISRPPFFEAFNQKSPIKSFQKSCKKGSKKSQKLEFWPQKVDFPDFGTPKITTQKVLRDFFLVDLRSCRGVPLECGGQIWPNQRVREVNPAIKYGIGNLKCK